MPTPLLLALVCFIALNLALFFGGALFYNRARTLTDASGKDVSGWSAKIELATMNADTARREVGAVAANTTQRLEQIEVEHYKRLRASFEDVLKELAICRADVLSLKQQLKLCETKLASEERVARRARTKAEKDDEVDDEIQATTLEELIRNGGAVPLAPGAPAAPTRGSNFGKIPGR